MWTTVPTWATAETPIADGLASFEATRGGIRFVQPPDVAEWEAATGVWTEATDAQPAAKRSRSRASRVAPKNPPTWRRSPPGSGSGICSPGSHRSRSPRTRRSRSLPPPGSGRKTSEPDRRTVRERLETTEPGLHAGAALPLEYVAAIPQASPFPRIPVVHVICPRREGHRVDLAREQAHYNDATFNVFQITRADRGLLQRGDSRPSGISMARAPAKWQRHKPLRHQ